ncbi:MBL fold metallo-hydrolase [Thioalkalivibrio sulfidiphilus]|uniref:Metallo-beta-lactamase family protein n=1 Tax=Thioalkalivibrio sulfidiphilus (strain HL-EbGR7) TaxID=396588 RepID=B8GSJ6_THISH|nr:MBL fold metallo-hydrolase [Thioalkalivibrio sulfidiphilus]ACL72900.1 metallo-beta-lactamase family protein [Thioalkalivibrio sulfidiphilus HL-EbGr7]
MKNLIFTLLLVSIALWLSACSGESQPPVQQQAAAETAEVTDNPFGMKVEQLAEGVYAIVSPARGFPSADNLGWNSNTAFVVTGDGVLMFDTGSSEAIGAALRDLIRTVTDQPVRWIINSHVHGDHWLGNSAFMADEPEQIIASDITIALMKEQGDEWLSRFYSMTNGAIGSFDLVPARDAVTESGSYQFADTEAYILRSERAHAPGDIALWLPAQRVLLAADVVYTERGPATFDSNVQGWIAMLDEMLALEPEVVLPGHGPVGGFEAVQNMRNYFQTLWDIVEEGYNAGMMDHEIAAQAREQMADFEAIYPGMDDILGESVSHIYLQVEAALF